MSELLMRPHDLPLPPKSVELFIGSASGRAGARGASVAVSPGGQARVGEYDLRPVAGLVPAGSAEDVGERDADGLGGEHRDRMRDIRRYERHERGRSR
jgi:hypothetical protein